MLNDNDFSEVVVTLSDINDKHAANCNGIPGNGINQIAVFSRKLNAKEVNSLKSVLLYKASVMHTTEAWVKECAELFLNVEDLFAVDAYEYEDVISFLMAFNG